MPTGTNSNCLTMRIWQLCTAVNRSTKYPKNIDHVANCCTMGIRCQNGTVKNKGCGTTAECLALEMHSTSREQKQHLLMLYEEMCAANMLNKVGFIETHRVRHFGAADMIETAGKGNKVRRTTRQLFA